MIMSGALVLVEPDDERRLTGISRSVAPVHRLDVGSDLRDATILHLCVRSHRRIGQSVRIGNKHEWLLSVKFDSAPKAQFARDQVEAATKWARQEKVTRTQAMLSECMIPTREQ